LFAAGSYLIVVVVGPASSTVID